MCIKKVKTVVVVWHCFTSEVIVLLNLPPTALVFVLNFFKLLRCFIYFSHQCNGLPTPGSFRTLSKKAPFLPVHWDSTQSEHSASLHMSPIHSCQINYFLRNLRKEGCVFVEYSGPEAMFMDVLYTLVFGYGKWPQNSKCHTERMAYICPEYICIY